MVKNPCNETSLGPPEENKLQPPAIDQLNLSELMDLYEMKVMEMYFRFPDKARRKGTVISGECNRIKNLIIERYK